MNFQIVKWFELCFPNPESYVPLVIMGKVIESGNPLRGKPEARRHAATHMVCNGGLVKSHGRVFELQVQPLKGCVLCDEAIPNV